MDKVGKFWTVMSLIGRKRWGQPTRDCPVSLANDSAEKPSVHPTEPQDERLSARAQAEEELLKSWGIFRFTELAEV